VAQVVVVFQEAQVVQETLHPQAQAKVIMVQLVRLAVQAAAVVVRQQRLLIKMVALVQLQAYLVLL
jgi:hypothetical protein